MSEQQREILSYLDREDNPGGDGEVIGREGFGERDVKKLAAQLEKAITVNESRRAKYEDPAKYVSPAGSGGRECPCHFTCPCEVEESADC
jgi:hypothetical protein